MSESVRVYKQWWWWWGALPTMWWYVVVASAVLVPGGAQPGPPPSPPTPLSPQNMENMPDGPMEMTQPDYDPTDMPPHLAALALNVDRGKYTNMRFHYQNFQAVWEKTRPDGLVFRHNCIEQFLQCMLSQSQPQVVCAYNNNLHETNGFWTSESSCHVYFDNCRRRYRVWRLIGHGKCKFDNGHQEILKDPGYKGNNNNHLGKWDSFPYPFYPSAGYWKPAPVTDPDLPPDS